MPLNRVLALVGPTAAGKSRLAVELASELGAEIVSVDSAMVYRGMDIGTDKPSEQDLARIPHHMVGVVDASCTFTVSEFQSMARAAIDGIIERGKTPLLVGGSGLYFRAVVDPFEFPGTDPAVRAEIEKKAALVGAPEMYRRLEAADPDAAGRIQPANVRRVVRALEVIELTGRRFSDFRPGGAGGGEQTGADEIYDLAVAGLSFAREELDRRIDARVDAQIERGLVDEVRRLDEAGFRSSATSQQALGYAQILEFLDGRLTLEDAIAETKRRTRKFARRQLSWFRADGRITWFESDPAGASEWLRKEKSAR
jgi:tRNA dimethylallyltransferase